MRKQFYEQEFFCVMCRRPIPAERLRYKSITCSDQCKKERKRSLYVRMSGEQCMFCRKPTSPTEQTLFRRFRKWAQQNPQLAFAAEFDTWSKSGGDPEAFNFEHAMSMLEASMLEDERKKKEKVEASIQREEEAKSAKRAGISSSSEVGSVGTEESEMQDHPS